MYETISPHQLDRVGALRAEAAAMAELAGSLTEREWQQPSAAPGWRVREVVAHVAAACHGAFTPWLLGVVRSTDVEAGNDRDAQARREWSPDRVLAEYLRWSPRFVRLQALVAAAPGLGRVPIRLGELGSFPLRLFASAFVFDHWTHRAHDIAPVLDRPAPVSDANRMAVVCEWMLAGLEQMNRETLAWLDRPVGLTLDGLGGGSWVVRPLGGGLLRIRPGDPDRCPARVRGHAAQFPLWGTTRTPWRDCDISLDGDTELGTRFLDSVDVV